MTRIVVGYDGSEQSHDALGLGVLLAEWIDANAILATIFPHMLPRVDDEGSADGFRSRVGPHRRRRVLPAS
jgi:hypothetical protein